jgi:hypothetical protein
MPPVVASSILRGETVRADVEALTFAAIKCHQTAMMMDLLHHHGDQKRRHNHSYLTGGQLETLPFGT